MAWLFNRAGAAVGMTFFLTVTGACGGSSKPPITPDGASSDDGSKGPAEVGKTAPDISLQTVNGKGQITRDSLSGKVAIVDFWATWCGPCKQSFPKLEELSKQNSGKVQVVGVSVDDKSDGVADFAKSNGATFAIGWDDGHTIATRWKVDSMPTTYILDGSGKIRFIHAGYHDGEADVIAKELATLAAEPSTGGAKDSAASTDKPAATPPPATDPPPATPATASTDDPNATPAPAATPPTKPGKGKKPGGKKPPKKKPATPAAPTQ